MCFEQKIIIILIEHNAIAMQIVAARWAREQRVPYLGVCLGLQVAVIEVRKQT